MILIDEGVGSITSVEYVFKVLAATYGAAWERSIGTAPVADVMTVWANALDGFTQTAKARKSIVWALNQLPEVCPNAVQFRNLCRTASQAETPRLPPPPPADPARVAAELAKLRTTGQAGAGQGRVDGREWARAILRRVASGERLSPTVVAMAQGALGGVGVEVA